MPKRERQGFEEAEESKTMNLGDGLQKEPEALAKGNLHLVDENAWAPSFYTNCMSNARARISVTGGGVGEAS